MNGFLKDVLNQPTSMRNALKGYLSAENLNKMDELSKLKFEKVLFLGMGSSHFCNYGAAIHLNNNGYSSSVLSASQVLHYENGLIDDKTLLILISQSGESAEIVSLIEKIDKQFTVVGITNNLQSTLGKRANVAFFMDVEDEEAVSTRTYLASILLTYLIAKSITGSRDEAFIQRLWEALEKLERNLQSYEMVCDKLKDFLKDAAYLCMMGRGYSLCTVRSGALFIREAAKFPSIDFDSGEFRHGPFEMVEKGFHGMVFAPEGTTYELNCKLADNIVAKGGKVILVTNKKPDKSHEDILVLEQEFMDEMLVPLIEVAPVQLTAIALADIKGIEAGKFRWSSKITNIE